MYISRYSDTVLPALVIGGAVVVAVPLALEVSHQVFAVPRQEVVRSDRQQGDGETEYEADTYKPSQQSAGSNEEDIDFN